jgi:hypothetical protein
MIYQSLAVAEALSQGDIIDECPLLLWKSGDTSESFVARASVVVLTQSCDLAQGKASRVVVAVVHAAQRLANEGILKESTIREQVRSHRVYGWYFLPAGDGIAESLVDLRDLHTVPRTLLESLIAQGRRQCRLATPFREHMAQHFSTTYSRIALPQPYETTP